MDTEKVMAFVSALDDAQIVLLRNEQVVRWLLGDLSFLPSIVGENKTRDGRQYKELEDQWGRVVMKRRRPDLTLDKQWTNKFGEHLCEELYRLQGKAVTKPAKKAHYQPDAEVEDAIVEAKAGTYHTGGTAGEKILGCPFKYAEIPDLYGKPLTILCLGGAEKLCREQYGNLPGAKCSPQKRRFLAFFRQNQIQFQGASEMLRAIVEPP